ncbi:MAG TPA: MarP family serine protease [Jatrophihabitans sp.]|jgi:S1-C subfamily serine protease
MNLLDLIIAVVAIAYGFVGFRNGAIIGVLSLAGFFGGAAIGAQVARPIVSRIVHDGGQVPVAIACVLFFAVLGQVIGSFLGRWLRRALMSHIASWGKRLDSAIGAVLGVVSVLLVAWIVAVPMASAPYTSLAGAASHSRIVRAINGVMPEDAHGLYGSLRGFLDRSGFPPVFGTLPSSPDLSVAPPSDVLAPGLQHEVDAARSSVLKIYGQAPSCSRGIEGSGFVIAPERVVTNAHVVAGTSTVTVEVPNAGTLHARVVLFDPDRDVAVLAVPGLKAEALHFAAKPAEKGDSAAVLGYPQDGPFAVRSARVGDRSTVRGNDIYGNGDIHREIYSLRATIRSGNSGGPLLAEDGAVLGIVFATALDSNDVGYALSDDEIAADVAAGLKATTDAATGHCT